MPWMARCAVVAAFLLPTCLLAQQLPSESPIGNLEQVALFNGAMPTGVTVSRSGRIFVNFPRWGDDVPFTVAEVKDGKAVAYPDAAVNTPNWSNQAESLISVQSVVVDPKDRLWILDTGSPEFKPTTYGGPKLIGIDLTTNKVFKKIVFPQSVALPTTYLNDIRFDLRRGSEGTAFITDSASDGPNGIIVVDLASGKSWRRLNDHPSTKADQNFTPIVGGQQLWKTMPDGSRKHLSLGSDGIAFSSDGKTLYYCPLISRHLYSISVDDLMNGSLSDDALGAKVRDLGDKGASDGMESDAEGRVYASDYEHDAIHRLKTDGTWETLVFDPRVMWPDTLSVTDGYLYFTANQLNRQKTYQYGKDLRQKPYVLFRVKIDGKRIAP